MASSDDADSDSSASDDETFTARFAGRNFATLRRAAAVYPIWTAEHHAVVLSHAVTFRYTAHSLPAPARLLHLAHLLALPTNGGRRVVRTCLRLLIGLVRRVASPTFTRHLIRETPTAAAYRTNHHPLHHYRVQIASVLAQYVASATDIGTTTSSSPSAPRRYRTSLLLAPITDGSLYATFVATDSTLIDVAPSPFTESALIAACLQTLIQHGNIITTTAAASFVPDLFAPVIPPATAAYSHHHYQQPPSSGQYGPPQPDPALLAERANQRHYMEFLHYIRDVSDRMRSGTASVGEHRQCAALWTWNNERVDRLYGKDYTYWRAI